MVAPVTVRQRDLRALAGIVTQDRTDPPPGEGLPPSLLADLITQIRCDGPLFQEFDSGRQTNRFKQGIPAPPDSGAAQALDEADKAGWEHHWDCQLCSYPDRTGDLRSIVKATDFYSTRQ